MENENIVYGRLTEAVHISGYSLERAMGEFEWLLEEDRWQKVGTGFDDINEFLKTLSFKEFKIAIEQREKIANKLAEIGASQRATAKMLGVDEGTIRKDKTQNAEKSALKGKKDIDFEEVINDDAEKSALDEIPSWIEGSGQKEVAQQKRSEEKIEERKKVIEEIKQKITIENLTITGLYDVIVIDPPWNYNTNYDPETRRGTCPYPEMTTDEISKIDLPLKDNAVMFLWTTHAFIRDAFKLVDIWGLEYKAIITWDKEKMGIGVNIRMQCEFCLLCTKGKPLITGNSERDIIRETRREHSRKPDAFYAMVGRLTTGRKLDYFSREKRENWDVYGIETERF